MTDREKKQREIIGKLINLPTDCKELSCFGIKDTEKGNVCQICGFPFGKEYREKCVDQVISELSKLDEEVGVEKELLKVKKGEKL